MNRINIALTIHPTEQDLVDLVRRADRAGQTLTAYIAAVLYGTARTTSEPKRVVRVKVPPTEWLETVEIEPEPAQASVRSPPPKAFQPATAVVEQAPAPDAKPERLPPLVNRTPPPKAVVPVGRVDQWDARQAARKKPAVEQAPVARGFDAVMALVAAIAAARSEALKEHPAGIGRAYNAAVGVRYAGLGVGHLTAVQRAPMLRLHEFSDQIHLYKRNHPEWASDPNLIAEELLKLWQMRQVDARSAPKQPTPELRKRDSDGPLPPDQTVVWQNNRFETVPASGILAAPGKLAPLKGEESVTVSFADFDSVELDNLLPGDSRILSRFARAMANLAPVTATTPQDKIAAAVNKLRNGDTSDTPKCAQTLIRLGVLRGASGAFSFRPEFVRRFEDVREWAEAG